MNKAMARPDGDQRSRGSWRRSGSRRPQGSPGTAPHRGAFAVTGSRCGSSRSARTRPRQITPALLRSCRSGDADRVAGRDRSRVARPASSSRGFVVYWYDPSFSRCRRRVRPLQYDLIGWIAASEGVTAYWLHGRSARRRASRAATAPRSSRTSRCGCSRWQLRETTARRVLGGLGIVGWRSPGSRSCAGPPAARDHRRGHGGVHRAALRRVLVGTTGCGSWCCCRCSWTSRCGWRVGADRRRRVAAVVDRSC